jgi:hypothetical protein
MLPKLPPLNGLRLFATVARCGSFKLAAQELNLTPARLVTNVKRAAPSAKARNRGSLAISSDLMPRNGSQWQKQAKFSSSTTIRNCGMR